MKFNYFTRAENKYVFNLSLIFWHIFIAISTLLVAGSLFVFIWSLIPASQQEVKKETYPSKKPYPAPVKVTLEELNLQKINVEALPTIPMQTKTVNEEKPIIAKDTTGKTNYNSSLAFLKTLIPKSKWNGSGFWTYPYGERYWTFYKQEKYRKWNDTEPGIEDRLKYAFLKSYATNYRDKKLVLDAYINVIRPISKELRYDALQVLIGNVASNVSQNLNICESLSVVTNIMYSEKNISYLGKLYQSGRNNPKDGPLLIKYVASIINNFDASKRTEDINSLITGYNNYFNQDFSMLKESTDLFLPFLSKIKPAIQPNALIQYYGVFRNKNYLRDKTISEIESEHQQAINEINNQFVIKKNIALQEYLSEKISKKEYRLKSLEGIGAGILLIVLIAVILVFFSIQRSVKKIEEKMSTT